MCKIIANLAMLIRTKISVFAVASWSLHHSVSFVSVDSKSFPPFRLMTPSTLTQTAFLRSCAVNWLMHFHGTGAEEFRLSWNSHDGGKDDDGLRPARLRPRRDAGGHGLPGVRGLRLGAAGPREPLRWHRPSLSSRRLGGGGLADAGEALAFSIDFPSASSSPRPSTPSASACSRIGSMAAGKRQAGAERAACSNCFDKGPQFLLREGLCQRGTASVDSQTRSVVLAGRIDKSLHDRILEIRVH
jgi:hypothetical protein